ncbi:unnamed protein product [Sphagnum troendelagicum]
MASLTQNNIFQCTKILRIESIFPLPFKFIRTNLLSHSVNISPSINKTYNVTFGVTPSLLSKDDPILKEVLKEPIAFLGGVFAGLLRLDLNEEPLREWVARTSEAAGLDLSESPSADNDDSIPEDIQID